MALSILSFIFLRTLRRRRRRGAGIAYDDRGSKHDGNTDDRDCVPGPHELEQKIYSTELPESESTQSGRDSSQVDGEAAVELPADTKVRSS